MTQNQERRRHNRDIMVRPCKLRDRRSLLFAAGETHDVSPGGAMVRIDSARSFSPGDEVDVAIAWNHDPVLASEGLVRARVRRVLPIDFHHQALALEFDRMEQASSPMTLARAA